MVADSVVIEIVTDFFSELKSASSGFASFDYEEGGYIPSDLVKVCRLRQQRYRIGLDANIRILIQLNMMLNGKPIDALAMIVHRSAAVSVGRLWTKKLSMYSTVPPSLQESIKN